MFGRPASSLRLLGGITWLDTEQCATGSAATDGKHVIGVACTQATLGAEWDVSGLSGLALDGWVTYTGDRYADAANTLRIPGYSRLDRYLLDLQGQLVTLRARIDNLTDRAHWASVGGFPGPGYLVVGAPRTVSVSASVDF